MLVASLMSFEEETLVGDLAHLIEIRLDRFTPPHKPSRPCIFTFRKKDQGGESNLSETERLEEFAKFLGWEPEYCDIEADTDPAWITEMARRFPRIKWIGSYHNFQETPTDLPALLQKMQNPHFSIYKIALHANSSADMLRLMLFAKECPLPLSAISMGEYGKPSRVLSKVFGGCLHYAGLKEDPTLGRYSLQELHEIFRFRTLNQETQVYTLLGDPVEHSVGHLFHNPRFGRNAVYVKMRMNSEDLKESFPLMQRLGFAGASVTMPLKEEICQFVEDRSGIGSVNTVVGNLGFNTDGIGALDAIEAKMNVVGKKIAVLGAGGTARAIVFEAKRRGASVVIFNRTVERAKKLGNGRSLEELKGYDYDILINTIPPTACFPVVLKKKKLVMDVSYSPKKTPLLQEADLLGCICIYGDEMFTNQGLRQQQHWNQALR